MEEIEEEKKPCPQCQKNEALNDHVCPYAADVNNDEKSLCNCCEECMHQCAMDI